MTRWRAALGVACAVGFLLTGCGASRGHSTVRVRIGSAAVQSVPRVPRLDSFVSGQRIVVSSPWATSTTAVFTAYQRTVHGWRAVLGPWSANVGRRGIAPLGAKREGDGRTPSGTFGFRFVFGVAPDPGVRFGFRHVTGPWFVWDDDPRSVNYNRWIDTRRLSSGANPEPLNRSPVYDYAAVIDYNGARTPGLGSAIFLHVSQAKPTTGCVSLPVAQLLAVLRWLDPAQAPQIVIGVGA